MTFGEALDKVKAGQKIFRHGWNGKVRSWFTRKVIQKESHVTFRLQKHGD